MLVVCLFSGVRRLLVARDRAVPHRMRELLFGIRASLDANDAVIGVLLELHKVCGVFELWRIARGA